MFGKVDWTIWPIKKVKQDKILKIVLCSTVHYCERNMHEVVSKSILLFFNKITYQSYPQMFHNGMSQLTHWHEGQVEAVHSRNIHSTQPCEEQ